MSEITSTSNRSGAGDLTRDLQLMGPLLTAGYTAANVGFADHILT